MLSLAVPRDTETTIAEYQETYPMNWYVGHDEDGTFSDRYGVSSTPTMILFNGDGDVLESWVGRTQYTTLANEIDVRLSGEKTAVFDGELEDVGRISGPQSSVIGDLFSSLGFQVIIGSILLILVYSKVSSPVPVNSNDLKTTTLTKKTPEQMFAEYEKQKKKRKN